MFPTEWSNPLTISVPAKASSSFPFIGVRTVLHQEEQVSIKLFLSACTSYHRHTEASFNTTKFGLESLFTFSCPLLLQESNMKVSLIQSRCIKIPATGIVAHNYNPRTWEAKTEVCVISVPALATEARERIPQMSLWNQDHSLETKPTLWWKPHRLFSVLDKEPLAPPTKSRGSNLTCFVLKV